MIDREAKGPGDAGAAHRAPPVQPWQVRPFSIIVFDLDGTAVTDRQEDATPVRERLTRLLEGGRFVGVVTGTNVQNVDRQISAGIVGPAKQCLYLGTNRGSEVYGFDTTGRLVSLWRRVATPWENETLDEIAEAVAEVIRQRTGLAVLVIANRLNRRKIDLIPEPAWANPPKSAIGALLVAVNERLRRGGLRGGIGDVVDLATRLAREKGLPDARITSDVKHVEVGLTDKGDSLAWIMSEVAAPRAIPAEKTLVLGDEFGPIDGVAGSDARMIIPAALGATFVSVGVEPGGVPPPVIHVGGGPPAFRAILDDQLRLLLTQRGAPASGLAFAGAPPETPLRSLRATEASRPAELPRERALVADAALGSSDAAAWILTEVTFEPAREHEIESLFTVANGYVGTRGAVPEHGLLSQPQTFVAGVFNRVAETVPELVVAPDWADFRIFVEGERLRLDRATTLAYQRRLDLRRGVFEHDWRCSDRAGRITRLSFRRFISLADRHALVESLTLTPENYSGRVAVESILDGRRATAPITLLPNPRFEAVARRGAAFDAGSHLLLVTPENPVVRCVVIFGAVSVLQVDPAARPSTALLAGERWTARRWEWNAELGRADRLDKLAVVWTAGDAATASRAAVDHLAGLLDRGAEGLRGEHVTAWDRHWANADVLIGSGAETQTALRFAIYHLIAAANPEDDRVSIGARGLTGAAYKGHVFWDTEIYMVPFFTWTDPDVARTLLRYRYHTLPGAREKARRLGYRGALFPWESTDVGEEATPSLALLPEGEVVRILTGEQEHHISADVAYATWQYWQATRDDTFFRECGAEIILETARFWASRVTRDPDGSYHIRGVIGPDEYHEGVDDDVYTNGMARWNLERGVETAARLQQSWPDVWISLASRLALEPDEIQRWGEVARGLILGFDPASGLYEQFRGYFSREFLDLKAYEPRTAPIDVILGPERVARSQIIKQPDVILLLYLLWDQFPPAVRKANFRYYEPRCAHGSSLSPSIHALVAARLGDWDRARRYFRQSAEVDLANNMGNAAEGVHLGAQGGLWQAVVFGAVGVSTRGSGLAFDPHVLPEWQTVAAPLCWRGRHLRVTASAEPRAVEVALGAGEPLRVSVGEGEAASAVLSSGRALRAEWTGAAWSPWREVAR